MDFAEIVNIALPVVYVLVGVALVWLIIELVLTTRKTRGDIADIKKQVEPTLANIEVLTEGLKPVVAKVDPLVERVSLTVDAANLELMRVDQILDDVNGITGSLSSAVEAVDTAANAPIDLVYNVSNRVRNIFKSRKASDESVNLGQDKSDAASRTSGGNDQSGSVFQAAKATAQAAAAVAHDVARAAKEGASDVHDQVQHRTAERKAESAARDEAAAKTSSAVSSMATAVEAVAKADASAAQEKYFTYENPTSQSSTPVEGETK